MEDVVKYLTQGRGSWNYRPETKLPMSFNQAIMFPVAKMWMQFIGTRIAPALNVSNVNVFRAFSLYGILQSKQFCVGCWIFREMKRCVQSEKAGLFFPYLVTGLCRQAEVPMSENNQLMKPMRRLVLQEFTRMNRLHAPKFPPNMFRPTLTHQDEGVSLKEEGVAQNYPGTED
ncbi:hypothetical protein Gogos_005513 [Gossypium gossypioides]|uniref:Putative plant transposon protein domain-containing protein n=1 Tax=Gossypium gossypioides TaxID=34282 RepID=A0A7J9D522_GOSGO|nr:hypothetical protein [Gossypium gossypioides]